MQEAGLSPHHVLTEQHSTYSLAETLLEQALSENTGLDGVFCTNDDIAIGTLIVAQQRGIEVPKQLSVVGYNALEIGQIMRPRLTSVDTPRFEMGHKSAELLLDRLKGKAIPETIIDLGYRITNGESV